MDEITQPEKRAILKNDCFASRQANEAQIEGRFGATERLPSPLAQQYPKGPAWTVDPCGPEPPIDASDCADKFNGEKCK